MLLNPNNGNFLYQLWLRLTAQRAANLDNLDATISSRLASDDAMAQFTALVERLSNIGHQCAIFSTPGAFTFTVPDGVKMVYLSACSGGCGGARSYSRYSGGGAAASILKLPLIVPQNRIITGVIGQGGTNSIAANSSAGLTTGSVGTATSVLGITIPVGTVGSADSSNSSSSGGIGGRWGVPAQLNVMSRAGDVNLNNNSYVYMVNEQDMRVQNYLANGAPGGIGNVYVSGTPSYYITTTTAGYGGASALLGVTEELSSGIAKAGCGGTVISSTANNSQTAGDGLVMIEWFGLSS